MDDSNQPENNPHGGGGPKNKQTITVLVVLAVVIAGAIIVPRVIRPRIVIPLSPSGGDDLKKQVERILTPSNVDVVTRLAGQVLSNVAKGQQTTVIISNVPPPVSTLPPPPSTLPGATPNPQPTIGGGVVSSPPPTPALGRPSLELYLMPDKKGLPAATDAPVAILSDTTDLFRAARFKEDPRFSSHQDRNLWLKWQGRINVPVSGNHSFFPGINMNRILPVDGRTRASDFGGRGKQTVMMHVYIDGQKVDSKDKRFSEIQGSFRTQADVNIQAGFHDIVLWLGIAADGARYLYDETSASLEVRFSNQAAPVKLTARDLAW